MATVGVPRADAHRHCATSCVCQQALADEAVRQLEADKAHLLAERARLESELRDAHAHTEQIFGMRQSSEDTEQALSLLNTRISREHSTLRDRWVNWWMRGSDALTSAVHATVPTIQLSYTAHFTAA
jgi:hypothetical protein